MFAPLNYIIYNYRITVMAINVIAINLYTFPYFVFFKLHNLHYLSYRSYNDSNIFCWYHAGEWCDWFIRYKIQFNIDVYCFKVFGSEC